MTTARQQLAKLPPASERAFALAWAALGFDPLETQVPWHPERAYRFDFGDVRSKVAIEVVGGVHTIRSRWEIDTRRRFEAQRHGWQVWEITVSMLREDPVRWLTAIHEAIEEGPR